MVDKERVIKIVKIVSITIVCLAMIGLFISLFINNSPTSKLLVRFMKYLDSINKVVASVIFVSVYFVALLLILPVIKKRKTYLTKKKKKKIL